MIKDGGLSFGTQLKIEVLPPNNGSKKCLEKSLAVKAIIHDIHAKAVEKGEKNQPINQAVGPSKEFMRGFYSRHPSLKKRSAEYVGHGRINMANKKI